MSEKIKCPHCGKDIEVTEVLTHQIRASMQAEVEGKLAQREREFAQQKAAIAQKEKEIAAAKEGLAEQVAAQVKAERQRIADEALRRAKEEVAGATKEMADEIAEKNAKIAEANRKEVEFLKEKRQLQEQKAAMELELARKLDMERKQIEEKARLKAAEEEALKLREKDNLIRQMQEELASMKHKLEKGSQEAQGEALEGNLKDRLAQTFAADIVEDVKKGARGADLVQRVRNHQLKECGVILWEAKNAQNFSKEWIAKLKRDQQEEGADVAVLATVTLPKEIDMFGMVDDVWVTDYKNAVCLSMALRHGLINVAREKLVAANQDTVKDVVYRYVTGPEFGMQVRSMVGAFKRMQEDLDSEKRAMQKYWKSREKQIETLVGGVTNIYAAVEGYVGHKALPEIDPLMLEGEAEE